MKKGAIQLTIALSAFALAAGLQTFAFSEPSGTPPANDAYAPLNTGPTAQDKRDVTDSHAAWITADGLGSRYGGLFATLGGSVAIGTTSANAKLDVAGEIRVGSTGVSCSTSNAGALRYSGGTLELCDGTSWTVLTASSGTLDFYGTAHTKDTCRAAGGTVTDYQTNSFCRFAASSCPSGWTKYQNLSTTQLATCGSSDHGCPASPCTTGNHNFANFSQETCGYTDALASWNSKTASYSCSLGSSGTCTASIIEVGCY